MFIKKTTDKTTVSTLTQPAQTEKQTTEEITQPQQEETFDKKAFGFHADPKTPGQYILVEVPYNSVTGNCGKTKVLATDYKEDIRNKFKITVVDSGMFD